MQPVRGQDDRKRERHAMDGVWLPAGERRPGARGFPGSRHTLGPGIVKGEAFSPLTRRRPPQVGKTPLPTRRNRISAWPIYRLSRQMQADAGINGYAEYPESVATRAR
jgi:hypothetical protein